MPELGLTTGTPDLRSAGPLLFHPDGILFAADVSAAVVFALDVADGAPAGGTVEVEHLDARIASLLGVDRDRGTVVVIQRDGVDTHLRTLQAAAL